MRPQSALWLDYWVGRAICCGISLVHKLSTRVIQGIPKVSTPKKILFLELSEMGAAILAYSAIKEAKERYPQAEFYFWIFKENAESVQVLNLIPEENVITARTDNIFILLFDILGNLNKIRKDKIDTVIDLELFSRFTSILTYFSRAKTRVGFYKFTLEGLNRADIYTHKVIYSPYNHISKNFLALVKSLDAGDKTPLLKEPLDSCKTTVPLIASTEGDLNKIWNKLKKYNGAINQKSRIVILNPGIGEVLFLRRWPIQNYIEAARRILKDEFAFVVLIGLKSEAEEINQLRCLADNQRFINLIGQTTVSEMIALCNVASLFISHDSGAVNLASLTPVEMVVLFGPETPLLYAPLNNNKKILYKHLACSPCFSAYNHRVSTCKDNQCLKMITVDEVCP